jgi:acylphosphatase
VTDTGIEQRGYRVTGRVQGVAFRYWVVRTAERIGLLGTVRNLPDGCVEIHARGAGVQLDRFEALLWQGPPAARVDAVEPVRSRPELPPESFEILC